MRSEPERDKGRPESVGGGPDLPRQQPQRKVCGRCGKFLLSEAFSRLSSLKGGLDTYCRNCRNDYMKEWRANNRERSREYSREFKRRWRSDPEKRARENASARARKIKREETK